MYRYGHPAIASQVDLDFTGQLLIVQVYGSTSNLRFRIQTSFNLRHLTDFLALAPKMKVQLRLGYVFGENGQYLGPDEYRGILAAGVHSLRLNGVDMDVHIRTHPRFMDEWVDSLVRAIFGVKSLYLELGFTFIYPFLLELASTGQLSLGIVKTMNRKLRLEYHLVYSLFESNARGRRISLDMVFY